VTARLIDCLATTGPLADIFADASVLRALLDVEAALALAAGRVGIIPDRAAHTIADVAAGAPFDAAALADDARASATPVIPLVKALVERVRAVDPDAAQYVHVGATSQDVSDTALILLLRRAHPPMAADQARLDRGLRSVSEAHARTVMLGRTLLQPATPITFGLKAARWWAAVTRSWRRFSAAWDRALVLQLGGAAGTLAAFGDRAPDVARELATALSLRAVPPWHTDRDRLGAFITAAALYTAALGKMARDVALLMQDEVGEVAEPGGGSSAMPHKHNPSACAVAVASAVRMPGLVAAFLTGMTQEHERSVGGSQAEWPTLSSAIQAAASAAAAMATAIEGLTVDAVRMRANLERTNGVVFAERAVVLLGARIGRDAARELVERAIRRTRETAQPFGESLRALPEISRTVPADLLSDIDNPEHYLGQSENLRLMLLSDSAG
jgi:3-carboxy-cis,cis-muconate cycloisomerase